MLNFSSCRRHSLYFLLAFSFLVGCGNPATDRLAGLWQLAKADEISERIPAKTESAPDEFGGAPKMEIEFLRNGNLTTKTEINSIKSQKQGKWKLLSFDEANNKMTIECELAQQTTICDIEFLGVNQIRLIPPNLAGLKLKLKFDRVR